jgi:hypothetical protein
MAPVVNPRGLTYKVTCHQWLINGMFAKRILPTICVHMCRVSRVGVQSSTRSDGHPLVLAGASIWAPFDWQLHGRHRTKERMERSAQQPRRTVAR